MRAGDESLRVDEWAAAHGGLRGSALLRIGVYLAVASLLVETGGKVLIADLETGPWGVTAGAWLGWIASLAVLGIGFVFVGVNPVLSRFGVVVGAFHLVHAAFLLVRIFTDVHFPVPPRTMVVGRVVLLVLFALQERNYLGPRGTRLLAGAAAFVLAKSVAAAWGLPGDLGRLGDALWNLVPTLLLLLALHVAADLIKRREDVWAEDFLAQQGGGFDDFHNPLNPSHRD